MSNRTFKSLLNNNKYILFDYGIVNSLPVINENKEFLSGICKYNQIFYIKQLNSNKWVSLNAKTILTNVYYGIQSLNDNYDWYNDIDKTKVLNQNNMLIWQHNLYNINVVLDFKCRQVNDTLLYTVDLPYSIIDNNNVAIDFTGFQNFQFMIIAN